MGSRNDPRQTNRPSQAWVRQRRAELASRASDAEKAAYKILVSLGYNPIRQYPVWTKRKMYFADLYLPSLRTIIEIDGGYHYTRNQKRLDGNRSSGLWRLGYHVVRLSNHDARDTEKIKNKLKLIIQKQYGL